MIKTVLSLDIGTTSLKAGLITAKGEVVFICRKGIPEKDSRYVPQFWFNCLEAACKKLQLKLNSIAEEVEICGISVSGNGPTVVTQEGLVYKWNEELSDELKQSFLEENKAFPQNNISLFMPKIYGLKKLFPKEAAETKQIFSGPEYLIYQLTGKAVTILPEKRYETAYWCKEGLEAIGVPFEKLPEYKYIGEKFGELTADAARRLGLKEGIPVFGAGPDFIAALIGTGTLSPGAICDRSGSSEGINFCVPEFIKADGIRTLPSVIPGLWNISVLIPKSSCRKEEDRILLVKEAIEKLREIASQNNFEFPDRMSVTGGQTRDFEFMKRKARTVGIKLAVNRCHHCELLGDACVAFTALGVYSSLVEAAKNIVRTQRIYESL